jgi:hypothetical protein
VSDNPILVRKICGRWIMRCRAKVAGYACSNWPMIDNYATPGEAADAGRRHLVEVRHG